MRISARGARIDEQVAVLRALWTEPVVTFKGRWHTIDAAGIHPLPVQRPIPLWIGGHADAALERTGKLADGWMPLGEPDERMQAMIERIHTHAREAGRDPQTIGIESRLNVKDRPDDQWQAYLDAWRALGATHISVNTMGAGLETPREHIETLRRAAEVLGVSAKDR